MEICRKLLSVTPRQGGAKILLDHAVMHKTGDGSVSYETQNRPLSYKKFLS